MCSIIGIISKNIVAPALVDSLKRMEYRGYDSVGVATLSTNKKISVRKGIGKVGQVNSSLDLEGMEGFVGIGHTRGLHMAVSQTTTLILTLVAPTTLRLYIME